MLREQQQQQRETISGLVARVLVFCEVCGVFASGQNITIKCVGVFGCTLVDSTLVFCANLNLTVVPQCIEDVELLDLNSSFLQRLRDTDFPADNFGRLRVLRLHNASLKLIEENALAGLNNLRELDLSANLLKSFYPRTFASNTLLERLNLSSNSMKKLAFNQLCLPKLQTLDLSNGFLEYVDETAFSNLSALQWLNLRENKLKTLSSFQLDVPKLLLDGNPWSCDCAFYVFASRRRVDLVCTDVDRNRRLWNETALSDADCEQQAVDSKQTMKKVSAATKLEKSVYSRTDSNSPRLMLDIYGYVLLGVGILVFLCCCCDNRKTIDGGGCQPFTSTGGGQSHCGLLAPFDGHGDSDSGSGAVVNEHTRSASLVISMLNADVDNYYADDEGHTSAPPHLRTIAVAAMLSAKETSSVEACVLESAGGEDEESVQPDTSTPALAFEDQTCSS